MPEATVEIPGELLADPILPDGTFPIPGSLQSLLFPEFTTQLRVAVCVLLSGNGIDERDGRPEGDGSGESA